MPVPFAFAWLNAFQAAIRHSNTVVIALATLAIALFVTRHLIAVAITCFVAIAIAIVTIACPPPLSQ